MLEVLEAIDFEGSYIFASDAEELFYTQCMSMECQELFAFIVQLHAQAEQAQGSMVSIGAATAEDYENMRSLAISALHDKEKAGLCGA